MSLRGHWNVCKPASQPICVHCSYAKTAMLVQNDRRRIEWKAMKKSRHMRGICVLTTQSQLIFVSWIAILLVDTIRNSVVVAATTHTHSHTHTHAHTVLHQARRHVQQIYFASIESVIRERWNYSNRGVIVFPIISTEKRGKQTRRLIEVIFTFFFVMTGLW